MEPSQSDPVIAVALKAVSKTYGATRALIDVDVEIHEGTVHALIGENGAGKSTALGAIAGRVDFDGGVVEVFGEPLEPGNLRAARRSGVSAIYQEFTIVPHLDAAANVFLGSVLSRFGVLSSREMRRRYVQLCAELDVRVIPAGVPVGSLSVAEQQLLEIMRSLVVEPRVILFDEPSASLAIEEREALYKAIEGLRKRGVTIVIVSHNFDEIERLADWITVFRNGRAITRAGAGRNPGPNSCARCSVSSEVTRRLAGYSWTNLWKYTRDRSIRAWPRFLKWLGLPSREPSKISTWK